MHSKRKIGGRDLERKDSIFWVGDHMKRTSGIHNRYITIGFVVWIRFQMNSKKTIAALEEKDVSCEAEYKVLCVGEPHEASG